MEDRGYQIRADEALHSLWSNGARSAVLVSPTGSGKTAMLARQVRAVLATGGRVLWLVHTRELVNQAASDLGRYIGNDAVGVLMAGHASHSSRPIQVASIQTISAREIYLRARLVVFDECHHTEALAFKAALRSQRFDLLLGGTATPERRDGKPLGDTFDHMVVAASYTELIEKGYLVPAEVLRPPKYLGSDLAIPVAQAVAGYCRELRTFAFVRRVADAHSDAREIRRLGIRAEAMEAEMPEKARNDYLAGFKADSVRALVNVNMLTEGVNVEEAGACVMGRSFSFAGNMIQATGRALRPFPGKTQALILDLSGSTHRHGLPDADRTYSLTGRAITHVGEREVQDRSDPDEPKILGIALERASRWDPSPESIELEMAAPKPPVPPEVSTWLEAQRERINKKRGKRGRTVSESSMRMAEKYAAGIGRR